MGFLLDVRIVYFFLLLGHCGSSLAIEVPDGGATRGAGRSLVSFKVTRGNVSFRCSPSGPCLPCEYSEKGKEEYRCSETGYRLPLKCLEIKNKDKKESEEKARRSLNTVEPEEKKEKATYTSYRSCLPAEADEKLSFLGFEMIMVCLFLISGFLVLVRQKRNIPFLGIGTARFPFGSSRL